MGPVDSPSPIMHVQLPHVSGADKDADTQLLQNIADRALKDSRVLFTVHKRSALDKAEMPPSIRSASRCLIAFKICIGARFLPVLKLLP